MLSLKQILDQNIGEERELLPIDQKQFNGIVGQRYKATHGPRSLWGLHMLMARESLKITLKQFIGI